MTAPAALTALLAIARPNRFALMALGALLGAVLIGAAGVWHNRQVAAVKAEARRAGQAEVQARWDAARKLAQIEQDARTSAAETELVEKVTVVRNVYRDRIKEVTRYVPAPGTACPADAEFVRLFNGAAAPR